MSAAITTQKELRAAFWESVPGALRDSAQVTTRKRQNDYSATVRCAWVDYIDSMARDGQISDKLAGRATL